MKKCVLLPSTTLWRLDSKVQTFCESCQVRVAALSQPKTVEKKKPETVDEQNVDEDQGDVSESETRFSGESSAGKGGDMPEDESQVSAEMMEPENPISAEEAAMHTESEGPEEPLIADSQEEKA